MVVVDRHPNIASGTSRARKFVPCALRLSAGASAKQGAQSIGRALVGLLDEPGVDVEGGRGVGLAEAAADGTDVDAERQELGSAEMAEVVELHAVEAELVSQPAEREGGVVRAPGLPEVDLLREQERVGTERPATLRRQLGAAVVVSQEDRSRSPRRGSPSRLVGLGVLLDELAAGFDDAAGDGEPAPVEVDVLPSERAHLAAARAGGGDRRK